MCTQKMRALSYIEAGKITYPPKPGIQTDISFYRVASLLTKRHHITKVNKIEYHCYV